jgi:hypothetical protein
VETRIAFLLFKTELRLTADKQTLVLSLSKHLNVFYLKHCSQFEKTPKNEN